MCPLKLVNIEISNIFCLQACTLFGMWFIPVVLGLKASWFVFLSTWVVYTLATMYVVKRAKEKPLYGSTPR